MDLSARIEREVVVVVGPVVGRVDAVAVIVLAVVWVVDRVVGGVVVRGLGMVIETSWPVSEMLHMMFNGPPRIRVVP